MATLGYQPNPAARSLVTAKSNMLGLLVSDTGLYGPAGMLNAMERQARQAGYVAVTVAVRPDSPDSWSEGIQHLSKMQVEGIATIALPAAVLEMARSVLPSVKMVAIDIDEVQKGIHSAGIDNESGGYLATKHLIELGHKKVLHISGPQTSSEASSRMQGYSKAMQDAGLKPEVVQGDWSAETGFRLGVELNFELGGYTAIFTANDALALGLMKALRMREIDVPGDVSLVGFDDIPESPYFYPPLTTVRQDFNLLGEAAIEILLSDLAGTRRKKVESLTPNLVIRESASRISSKRKTNAK